MKVAWPFTIRGLVAYKPVAYKKLSVDYFTFERLRQQALS